MLKPLKHRENPVIEPEKRVFHSRGTYYLVSPYYVPGVYHLFRSRVEMACFFGVRPQSLTMQKVDAVVFRYNGYEVFKLRFEDKKGRIVGGYIYVLFEVDGGRRVTLHRNIKNLAAFRGCHVNGPRRGLQNKNTHRFRDKDFVIKFKIKSYE